MTDDRGAKFGASLGAGVRVVLVAAWVQVACGLAAAAMGAAAGPSGWLTAHAIQVLHVVVLASGATVLLREGTNRAALALGGFFLIASTSFAAALYLAAADEGVLSTTVATAMSLTRVEAFLPFFLFEFVRCFPRAATPPRLEMVVRAGSMLSAVAATALVAVNVAVEVALARGVQLPAGVASWHRTAPEGGFWLVVFGLTLVAIPMSLMRGRYAIREERHRALLFLLGIGAGLAPLTLAVVASAVSSTVGDWMANPANFLVAQAVVYPAFLSIPFTTAYAVLVEQMLDLRVALGMALRYGLARGSVLTITLAPLALLIVFLGVNRDQPIVALLTGPETVVLAALGIVGAVALRSRTRLLDVVDRRFFRERYDASAVLATLGHHTRSATDVVDLADSIPERINAAMHLDRAALLTLDETGSEYASPTRTAAPLAANWTLTSLLQGSSAPLRLKSDDPASPFARLPDAERDWIENSGFEMLVPLFGGSGDLVGAVGLGAKRSEMPFSERDERLLISIATPAGLVIEKHLPRQPDSPQPVAKSVSEPDPARECPTCMRVFASGTASCEQCASDLSDASVPHFLAGKFRVDRRVGAGGMGVVYSAVDVNLRRRVALKALPRASHPRVLRMRREARAMAAVSHPNLASIYGLEPWRLGWVLIMEYVDGGTLTDQLERGPMSTADALAMGRALAASLECLHESGILHRDVKPSNIGVMEDGRWRLMDFGVVRILSGASNAEVPTSTGTLDPAEPLAETLDEPLTTSTGAVVGSPLYLSPEAALGESPVEAFDLWSLSLVLYEAIAGRNPMRRETVAATLSAITDARVPDVRTFSPDVDAGVAEFLARALARKRADRFASAAEFRSALAELV
ncbi:MAG: protein kinase [Acidobacteria bacterium]|nr:protein kinase [Acidobacteriota bacterium]